MNSGNRSVTLLSLTLLGLVVAADAGRVGEDGTGAMWIAPELLELVAPVAHGGCTGEVVVKIADLASAGRNNFEWNPKTGELSFDVHGVRPQVNLPEDWLPDPELLALTPPSCGSR